MLGNKNTNNFLPAIALVVIMLIIATAFLFNPKKPATKQSKQDANSINSEDKQILSQIEQQLQIALQSGGISPENYDLINGQLEELEAEGEDLEKIKSLRVLMSKLEVGDRGRTASIPEQSHPVFQTPQEKSGVMPPPPPQVSVPPRQPPPPQTLLPQQPQESHPASQIPSPAPPPSQVQPQPTPPPPQPPPPPPVSTPACQSNPKPVFTKHITDTSQVNYIVPPPTLGSGPSLKTHSYIGTDHARVPIYAPADMTLFTGSYYIYGPYGLDFRVSCEVTLRFGHVTEPLDEIKSVFPPTPASDSKSQNIDHEISFKAGDLIAYTTGTTAAGNWDFGVYNSSTSNRYAQDPDWNNSSIYTTAVCPFDYFTASLKSVYVSKFNPTALGGNPPHGESFCQ